MVRNVGPRLFKPLWKSRPPTHFLAHLRSSGDRGLLHGSRLEQWANATSGLSGMFVYGKSRVLEPTSKSSALKDMFYVFEGQFTVKSDKAKIVDTVLGLYAMALDEPEGALLRKIEQDKERALPREFFAGLSELVEEHMSTADATREMTMRKPSSSPSRTQSKQGQRERRRPSMLDIAFHDSLASMFVQSSAKTGAKAAELKSTRLFSAGAEMSTSTHLSSSKTVELKSPSVPPQEPEPVQLPLPDKVTQPTSESTHLSSPRAQEPKSPPVPPEEPAVPLPAPNKVTQLASLEA